jgi:hypothetical protein
VAWPKKLLAISRSACFAPLNPPADSQPAGRLGKSGFGQESLSLEVEGLPVKPLAKPDLHSRVSSGSAVSAERTGVAPPRRLERGRSHILAWASV